MAFDAFMYFEGGATKIEGESTDKVYSQKKAFEVYSFSWGASNPVTIGSGTSGAGAGKVSISSFNIMKKTDKASPTMFQACCQGVHYPTANVVLRKAGGTNPVEYLKYVFSTVFIESIQWSGSSGGDDTPTESVSFAFGKCELYYEAQSPTGGEATKMSATWDLTKNIKG